MLRYLKPASNTLTEDVFVKKFYGKSILVMGSGPSVNLVNWKNLKVDGIVTTSFFYLNNEVTNLSNIIHVTLTDLVDLTNSNLLNFLNTNIDCTIAFEPKEHPFYKSDEYVNFNKIYQNRIVYYNTNQGKKEGVAGRLCYFIMNFSPNELYYVGIDGKSNNPENDPSNAFRTHLKGDADGYDQKEFVESHIYFANNLYAQSLRIGTKLYNLGEQFEFNCSSTFSKQYFPLSKETKNLINYE